jgi:ATP-binding cassette subfamily B protein
MNDRRRRLLQPADALLMESTWLRPGAMVLLATATAAGAAVSLALPALFGGALDAALGRSDDRHALALLAAATVCVVLAALAAELAEVHGSTGVTAHLRVQLVRQALSLRDDRRIATGDVVSRIVSDAPRAAGLGPLLIDALAGTVMSVAALVLLWQISWPLVVTLALGAPFAAVIAGTAARDTTSLTARYLRHHGELATRLVETLDGLRTIRASGTVEREVARILEPLPALGDAGRALSRLSGRVSARTTLLGPLLTLTTIAVAGHGVATGALTPGEMITATGYLPMALGLLASVELLAEVATLRVAARRCADVLAADVSRSGRRRPPVGSGELRFCAVSVTDGERTLLDGVSLTVRPGTSLAIVGRSGAGKSTLAAVAAGLIVPTAGHLLLDGVPIHELDPVELRNEVACAFERPVLLGSSIRDALSYGGSDIPIDRIAGAARLAQIDGFIRRLADGFDADVATTPMSGGERQRLGLARAFARDPRLLVLDDATSSLDTLTEARVHAAITRSFAGRTRLVVAHRVATAADADAVAWMEDGRVRVVASHAELWLERDYRAIFGRGADMSDRAGGRREKVLDGARA